MRGWHVDKCAHLGLLRARSIGDDLMTEVRYAPHGKLHSLSWDAASPFSRESAQRRPEEV
jgi:hypothetical protein